MSLLKTIGLKLIGAKGIAEIESAAIASAASGIISKAVDEATPRITREAIAAQTYTELRVRLLSKLLGGEDNVISWADKVAESKLQNKNPVVLRSKLVKELKEITGDSTRAGATADLLLDSLK
ncbi:hypothetical protein AVT69_gp213 [Pseudomonas phage PhiPA3]|uniref:Uncharacterized protein 215 n=1 Tax=Pseudomonas phage PhiPA3 TaxID=998086 RepID=F8SJ58_BPPA3|nr:hypothetical protein AVT69_gp213 [Pseudomonas phage PhiPA3]AEH03638.1 hypothetical protein [Pseudomonas phage PhiPA3]